MNPVEKFPSFFARSRSGIRDSAAMIVFTAIALFVAGLVTPEGAVNGARLDVVGSVIRLASPAVGVWAILVLAIGLLGGVGVAGRAAFAIVAAVVSSVAVSVATSGPNDALGDGVGAISLFALGVRTVGFASVVAIGSFGAAMFLRNRSDERPRAVAAIVITFLLAVGASGVSALILNWLNIYFRLFGTTPEPSASDADTYLRTAGLVVVVPVVCLVVAIVFNARSLVVLSAVFLVGWSLAAVILAVPQDRFTPGPETPAPVNSNYQPCYSGSNNCEGG